MLSIYFNYFWKRVVYWNDHHFLRWRHFRVTWRIIFTSLFLSIWTGKCNWITMCDTWPANKNWRRVPQRPEGQCHAMYNICKRQNMDRFMDNGLPFPTCAQPTISTNKSFSQAYTNRTSPTANQQAAIPRYGHQVPALDWSTSLLPDICNSYTGQSHSYVQSLNSTPPSNETRTYQSSTRVLQETQMLPSQNAVGKLGSPVYWSIDDIWQVRVTISMHRSSTPRARSLQF